MGLSWNMGGESGNKEQTFNVENANKWTDVTIPLSGQTLYVSGAGAQLIGPLTYNTLYEIVNKKSCHIVATTNDLMTATVAYQFFPAENILYHIPVSGSSEYLSIVNHDGSVVEAWVSIAERT
jgi:hypothetical protein